MGSGRAGSAEVGSEWKKKWKEPGKSSHKITRGRCYSRTSARRARHVCFTIICKVKPMIHSRVIAVIAALTGIGAFAQQDLTPTEILQKVQTTYQHPQRYYFAAVETVSGRTRVEIVMAAQRPDKVRMEMKGGGLATALAVALAEHGLCARPEASFGDEMMILIDGRATWAYFAGSKQYSRAPGGFVHVDPNDLESDVKPGTAADFATHVDDLFLKRYRTYTKFAAESKVLRTEVRAFRTAGPLLRSAHQCR